MKITMNKKYNIFRRLGNSPLRSRHQRVVRKRPVTFRLSHVKEPIITKDFLVAAVLLMVNALYIVCFILIIMTLRTTGI